MSLYTDITSYTKYMSKIKNETLEKIKTYHFHLQDTKDKNAIKHMTLATKVIDSNTIMFGVAFCSAKDKFDKKIGSELAYKKLTNIITVKELKSKKILRKIFGYLALNNNVKDAEFIILFNLAKYLYNI